MRFVVLLAIGVVGCSAGVRGTYEDETGSFVLDLGSGGKASFTFPGDAIACDYRVEGARLMLDCPGDALKLVLTIHADGSMTGPRESVMPILRPGSAANGAPRS